MSDSVTLALAGDTMLGRGVGVRIHDVGPRALFSDGVKDVVSDADLVVLNLECCVSDRGHPWPGKRFHFRAPPKAVDALAWLGVDCVTLANNHALDFGYAALSDTVEHLTGAGIRAVGAGADQAASRAPVVLEAGGLRVGVLGMTDHPADYAAGPKHPGVAHADLRHGVPEWTTLAIDDLSSMTDVVLVTPHWGPNMTPEPVPHVRSAAPVLTAAGATLVAGHSAHVFHGVAGNVLYDLGDLIDDYAVHPLLRNDLGLLFLVTVDAAGPQRVEAVPIVLRPGYTRLARRPEQHWIAERFTESCEALGTEIERESDRLVVRRRPS
jgi:poly-gamma-glutamate capsule biosynthesis protein CapA/YwtB (metallophosphatase superfamily)